MTGHLKTISDLSAEDTGLLSSESGDDTICDAVPEVVATASLVVVEGASKGWVYPLVRPVSTIGRGRNADVSIASSSISQQHARIELRSTHHFLVDLGSTNGTSLNGKILTPNEPRQLEEGDSISIADQSLIYLKASSSDTQDVTQALQRIATKPTAIVPAMQSFDFASLVQLLQIDTGQSQESTASIDDVIEKAIVWLRVAKRYALLGFVSLAVASLGGVGSVAVAPPLTEASCTILLKPNGSLNPLKVAEENGRAEQNAQFFVTSEQDFVGETLVSSTMKQLNKKAPTTEEFKDLSKRLQFDSVAQATYRATYKDRDSKRAVAFLDAHLKNYLEMEVNKMLKVVQAQVDFLSGQAHDNEVQLRETERKLQEFKQQNLEGLPEFTKGRVDSREELYTRQAEIRAQADKSNLELSEARRRLAEMRFIPETADKEAEPYKQALVDVNRRLSEAKAKGLGDGHPDVVALTDQANRLRTLIAQTQHRKISGVELEANQGLTAQKNRVSDLEVAAKAAGAELGQIGGQLGRLDQIVKKMPDVEARYAELSRSYEGSKDLQSQLYEKLRASQIQLAFDHASAAAQFEVPIPPRSDGVPIRRTLLLRAGIGAGIGLIFALMVAMYREVRRYLRELPKRRAQRLATSGHRMLISNPKS